jgi:hypothetical protein
MHVGRRKQFQPFIAATVPTIIATEHRNHPRWRGESTRQHAASAPRAQEEPGMAQVQQKTPPTYGRSVANPNADAAKPASGFRLKLPSFLSPNTASGTPRGPWSRLITGMIVLLVGFEVISVVISFIFGHLPRATQDALSSPLASKNTFLLGGLTGVELIFFLLIGAFYIALFRYNIIPRDPFNQRARATARVAANRPATGAINLTPQARASRRQAAVAAATAAANAKSGKNGKSNVKTTAPMSSAKTTAPTMKAKAGQSTVAVKPALAASQSGAHDAEYERIKALQRQQRRREAKR